MWWHSGVAKNACRARLRSELLSRRRFGLVFCGLIIASALTSCSHRVTTATMRKGRHLQARAQRGGQKSRRARSGPVMRTRDQRSRAVHATWKGLRQKYVAEEGLPNNRAAVCMQSTERAAIAAQGGEISFRPGIRENHPHTTRLPCRGTDQDPIRRIKRNACAAPKRMAYAAVRGSRH